MNGKISFWVTKFENPTQNREYEQKLLAPLQISSLIWVWIHNFSETQIKKFYNARASVFYYTSI